MSTKIGFVLVGGLCQKETQFLVSRGYDLHSWEKYSGDDTLHDQYIGGYNGTVGGKLAAWFPPASFTDVGNGHLDPAHDHNEETEVAGSIAEPELDTGWGYVDETDAEVFARKNDTYTKWALSYQDQADTLTHTSYGYSDGYEIINPEPKIQYFSKLRTTYVDDLWATSLTMVGFDYALAANEPSYSAKMAELTDGVSGRIFIRGKHTFKQTYTYTGEHVPTSFRVEYLIADSGDSYSTISSGIAIGTISVSATCGKADYYNVESVMDLWATTLAVTPLCSGKFNLPYEATTIDFTIEVDSFAPRTSMLEGIFIAVKPIYNADSVENHVVQAMPPYDAQKYEFVSTAHLPIAVTRITKPDKTYLIVRPRFVTFMNVYPVVEVVRRFVSKFSIYLLWKHKVKRNTKNYGPLAINKIKAYLDRYRIPYVCSINDSGVCFSVGTGCTILSPDGDYTYKSDAAHAMALLTNGNTSSNIAPRVVSVFSSGNVPNLLKYGTRNTLICSDTYPITELL